jgi:hypothetical protein
MSYNKRIKTLEEESRKDKIKLIITGVVTLIILITLIIIGVIM